jgi:hypothetical protein
VINQKTPSSSRVWYDKPMKDIPVADCDKCLSPYWDETGSGLCPACE